ncbi:MAG TPA: hypothetical protein VLM80_13180 [Anaerolineales bacterium]|nr:hypothetical protein [Anaerolineales bacterium]
MARERCSILSDMPWHLSLRVNPWQQNAIQSEATAKNTCHCKRTLRSSLSAGREKIASSGKERPHRNGDCH